MAQKKQKQSDLRKLARNKERQKLFDKFSECIREARAEINIEMAAKGPRSVKESSQNKARRLKVYWRKVQRRARKIYGKPMPRGYEKSHGNLWVG